MYTGFTHMHSVIRYALVVLILIAIVLALKAFRKNEGLKPEAFKIVKLSFILTHVQLLLGLALFFISPKVQQVLNDSSLLSVNKELTFYSLQHPLQMLIAIAIITIGYIKAKKLTGLKQSQTLFVYWSIAYLMIFISIPWPFLKDFGTWF